MDKFPYFPYLFNAPPAPVLGVLLLRGTDSSQNFILFQFLYVLAFALETWWIIEAKGECQITDVLQGDHSGFSLGLIDNKTKVPFQYMLLILKRNISFYVNKA